MQTAPELFTTFVFVADAFCDSGEEEIHLSKVKRIEPLFCARATGLARASKWNKKRMLNQFLLYS